MTTNDAIITEIEAQRNMLASRCAKFAGEIADLKAKHALEIAALTEAHRREMESEAGKKRVLVDRVTELETQLAAIDGPEPVADAA